jgi:hypothetical protein
MWNPYGLFKKQTRSAYRKLIKQGMADIGINPCYGPYSLKHAAINKMARFKYGVTHYNLTSSNLRTLNRQRKK